MGGWWLSRRRSPSRRSLGHPLRYWNRHLVLSGSAIRNGGWLVAEPEAKPQWECTGASAALLPQAPCLVSVPTKVCTVESTARITRIVGAEIWKSPMQLAKHAFLITGGSSGLGAACARRL